MSSEPIGGRSIVTRRAIRDIVRAAALGSYGVTGFSGGPFARAVRALGLRERAIRIRFVPVFAIELDLTVAYGLPVAEVARQVDSAVRYAVAQATGREIASLAIHVGGLRYEPGARATVAPPVERQPVPDFVMAVPAGMGSAPKTRRARGKGRPAQPAGAAHRNGS